MSESSLKLMGESRRADGKGLGVRWGALARVLALLAMARSLSQPAKGQAAEVKISEEKAKPS